MRGGDEIGDRGQLGNRMELEEKILTVLTEKRGLKAREINKGNKVTCGLRELHFAVNIRLYLLKKDLMEN